MHPLPPITVERIRAQLARRGDRGHGSATLVSLLAYAGLRPQEALALTWRDVRDRTLLIERALAFGEGKRTKTHARRTVPLVAPLAQDLAELRLAAGRPADRALLRPREDGRAWQDHDWRNWRKRVHDPRRCSPASRTRGRTTCATPTSACSSTRGCRSSR